MPKFEVICIAIYSQNDITFAARILEILNNQSEKRNPNILFISRKILSLPHEHTIYSKCESAHTDDDNKVFDVIGNRENKDAMRILFIENQIGIINALDCLNGGIGMSGLTI
ncbi:MAG: hypothetical protein SPM31_08745 [Prevotella sp.]|nr:hypothetical protein [Prevotella sp.]